MGTEEPDVSDPERHSSDDLYGLKGWLGLLGFLLFTGLVNQCIKIREFWKGLEIIEASDEFSSTEIFIANVDISCQIILTFSLCTVIFFYIFNHRFFARAYLSYVGILATYLVVVYPDFHNTFEVLDAGLVNYVIAISLLTPSLWAIYVLKSKRVKNTFTKAFKFGTHYF